MLKCLKSELLLLKTKRHYFDVGSIAHNVGGMVSWGLDTDNLSTSRNLIESTKL